MGPRDAAKALAEGQRAARSETPFMGARDAAKALAEGQRAARSETPLAAQLLRADSAAGYPAARSPCGRCGGHFRAEWSILPRPPIAHATLRSWWLASMSRFEPAASFLRCSLSAPVRTSRRFDSIAFPRMLRSTSTNTDQPHVLFFKGEGYEPTMVVLDIEETADGPVLSPQDLCFELNLARRSRELELEIEE